MFTSREVITVVISSLSEHLGKKEGGRSAARNRENETIGPAYSSRPDMCLVQKKRFREGGKGKNHLKTQ